MKCLVSVTFGYLHRAPQTHRIELAAGGPQTIVQKGVMKARKYLKPKGWCSLVVVLERLDEVEIPTETT